ncbi:protein-L-isoaspartate(D-aspartate) O-methyltransferase [Candidatus Woesearchaeota archaeon]|nr:protein-L-isoaspartate(D-aspartate) O-methyltransferase [Candidatus Woesearchaeota archaeon]
MEKSNKIILITLIVIIFLAIIQNVAYREPEPEEVAEKDEFAEARKAMIDVDIEARGVSDIDVLEAMNNVKRHNFVPENVKAQSYADHPLPIGYGQTISQPYIVALMTESLELKADDKVLEIGTGSGYQAAVLAEIVDDVYSIEIIKELAERAEQTLESQGYRNVRVKNADGYFGWEEHAPFDAIIITAAADHIAPPLIEQLADGGRLIIPLGSVRYHQTLTLAKKHGNNLETEYITSVRFVPMTGEALKKS